MTDPLDEVLGKRSTAEMRRDAQRALRTVLTHARDELTERELDALHSAYEALFEEPPEVMAARLLDELNGKERP